MHNTNKLDSLPFGVLTVASLAHLLFNTVNCMLSFPLHHTRYTLLTIPNYETTVAQRFPEFSVLDNVKEQRVDLFSLSYSSLC